MKVLILNTNTEQSPDTLLPLGACAVASAARASGHETSLVDVTFARRPAVDAARAVSEFRPDVIGASVRNLDNCDGLHPESHLSKVRSILRSCREVSPATLVLGGPAVTCAPKAVLSHLEGDYAVIGEGERAFPALLDALEGGQDPCRIPGVLRRGQDCPACPPSLVEDLSLLPQSSVEPWLDTARYLRSGASMPVQTKRGCAFDCAYCSYREIEGRVVRLRDPHHVASDIEAADRLGFRTVELVDSVFNVPEGHAIACCEAIARRAPNVALQSLELNPLGCSPELVKAMDHAGFSAVGCTAESGSDEVLSGLGKGFEAVSLAAAARELQSLEALRMWILMLCGPDETEATVRETARFMEKCLTPQDLVYVGFGVRIMPGTRMHARAVADGVVSAQDDLLSPRFYFSERVAPARAMSILSSSGFPSKNIVCLSDGNSGLLPFFQRAAHALRIPAPYWRLAPVWNTIKRPWTHNKVVG